MKSEFRVFGIVAVFLYVMAVVYPFWTKGTLGHVDWVGTTALILSALLCTMCGGYFWFVSRRIHPRPEDRGDAEMSDGAGEVGFFSPGSYWPFGAALGALTAAVGIAVWQPWIIVVGLVGTIIGGAALIFEYYTGTRRAH
jgi:hypothetical protein